MLEFVMGISVGLIIGFVLGLTYYTPMESIFNRWRTRKDPFSMALGQDLDSVGLIHGVSRRRYLWIFKESERSYRGRILSSMRAL